MVKIFQQSKAIGSTFFGVELTAEYVFLLDGSSDIDSVIRISYEGIAIGDVGIIGVGKGEMSGGTKTCE